MKGTQIHWQLNGQAMDAIFNGILLALKLEGNSDTCHNMDEH